MPFLTHRNLPEFYDMSEIVYKFTDKNARCCLTESNVSVYRLERDDYLVFLRHLELCGQCPISRETWEQIYDEGIVYFGIFTDGEMASRACIEIISPNEWEIADVRTVCQYRKQGYAFQLCLFVLDQILSGGKMPTIRTKKDNLPMQKLIDKLGFTPV